MHGTFFFDFPGFPGFPVLVGTLINQQTDTYMCRLAPVLKTIFHQCVISYTCSQSNSDGSVLKQS